MKTFNTTGPCRPGKHFMLPPIPRIPEARELIDEEKYFVIRGPRQSGKTTSLQALTAELRDEGEYAAVYISCESASTRAEEAAPAEVRILSEIAAMAQATGLPEECLPPEPWPAAPGATRLLRGLSAWARRCPRPIVLLMDEIDSIHGDELISVLRQLRQGYNSFPVPFPHSVALCGMRDVRDYKAASGGDPSRLVGPSPFNILAKSMRLADFTFEQVAELYGQHTDATGQEFTAHAIQRAFHASQGQPWLVNALAREIIREMRIPVSQSITDEHMHQAVERPDPVEDGLHQLDGYLDRLDLSHGTLIVFDRRPTAPHLLERTAIEQVTSPRGHAVTLVRA